MVIKNVIYDDVKNYWQNAPKTSLNIKIFFYIFGHYNLFLWTFSQRWIYLLYTFIESFTTQHILYFVFKIYYLQKQIWS